MNNPGRENKASRLPAGKGIVIFFTLFFSCISFTLGFFVGKYGAERRPETQGQIAVPVPSPQPAPAPLPLPQQEQTLPPQAGETAGTGKTPEPEHPQQISPKMPEPPKGAGEPEPGQVKKTSQASDGGSSPEPAGSKEINNTSRYAVQLGAFRSKAEAERCRAKYSGKGYKIYIGKVKEKKDLTIYKVRTGEFNLKKDAEALAARLKKSHGLKAFVIPVNE